MSNPPKPLSQKERNYEIQRLEEYNKYLDSLLKDAISKMQFRFTEKINIYININIKLNQNNFKGGSKGTLVHFNGEL